MDNPKGLSGTNGGNRAEGRRWLPRQVISGEGERIFSVLPESVLANFLSSTSENALLWNVIYQQAQPTISFRELLKIRPLWGNSGEEIIPDDALSPYYWGYDVDGQRLKYLDDVLLNIDGGGPKTEVDLFLLGKRNLILVESKRKSGFGRCSRFSKRRCPELHPDSDEGWKPCRYWSFDAARFDQHLVMEIDSLADGESPACNRHYQLARTLTIGLALADLLSREFHLWTFVPRKQWPKLERDWLDFSERVHEDPLWRTLRVIAWEDVQALSST